MICRVGETARSGRAVDCPVAVCPMTLAEAVRRDAVVDGPPPCRIRCRSPAPVHRHVGAIHPEMGLKVRTALARAGRARGRSTPLDARISTLERRLATVEVPSADPKPARRAVARTAEDTAERAEAVAERRGRLAARRTLDADVDGAEADLAAAVADLADTETAGVAARQAHDRARRRARDARTHLGDRLAIEDDLANARRAARAWLVDRLEATFAAALRQVPGVGRVETPLDAPPVPAALAVARVARPVAPVVLGADRFPDASAAAAWLGAPVVRV